MWTKQFCEARPLQVMSFPISKFSFFVDTLSSFANVGWRVRQCSKVGSCFHVAHEIALNRDDKYLGQFFLDHKVLEFTSKQLVKTFIKLLMFGCNRARCVLLAWAKSTCGPIWVRKGPKSSKKSFQRSHRIGHKRTESYIRNMPNAFSWKDYFMSNLYFEHIIKKYI